MKKDKEGLPALLKHANVPFNDIKMSMIMLCAVLDGLLTAYWAKICIGHFLTSTKDVWKGILLLEPEHCHTQMLQDIVEK